MRSALVFLLMVCALHAEGNPDNTARSSNSSRHRHPPPQDLSHRSANKLRHHASAIGNHLRTSSTGSAAKSDKFPNLRSLNKRLDTLRSPTTTTTTPRAPYFFGARTKDRPRWKYIHDYDDDAQLANEDVDVDDEYDLDDADDSYVDEVERTTSTTTEAPTARKNFAKFKSGDGYDDDTHEEDANDDYYDEEIFAEDGFRPQKDIQAEESVHEQSPITRYKWAKYGTRQALEESRRHSDFGNNDRIKNVRAANEHFLHMKAAAKCRQPRPRVINVQEVHQLPGKAFRPHCTVLHRCGDDTGCCQGNGKKCRAQTQEIIYLHFYVYSITLSQSQTVERLAFYNHTECACLDEEEMKVSQRLIRSRDHYSTSHNSLVHDKPSCTCPEAFVPTLNHRFGRCACDCPPGSDPHSGCINMKRGKEHLSMRDRKCILHEKCTPPTCEYGTYAKKEGRCPRRHEAAGAHRRTATPGSSNAIGTRGDSDNDDDSIED